MLNCDSSSPIEKCFLHDGKQILGQILANLKVLFSLGLTSTFYNLRQ